MSHLKNIVPVNVILNLLYDLKNALIIKKQNAVRLYHVGGLVEVLTTEDSGT